MFLAEYPGTNAKVGAYFPTYSPEYKEDVKAPGPVSLLAQPALTTQRPRRHRNTVSNVCLPTHQVGTRELPWRDKESFTSALRDPSHMNPLQPPDGGTDWPTSAPVTVYKTPTLAEARSHFKVHLPPPRKPKPSDGYDF
eukprot:3540201-Prymnesium_polylepis.1